MAEKIVYLDGLRGLAALIVVVHHFMLTFYPNINTIISETPLNLFYNGNFAVCIFFVLSGYVLTYRFFKTKEHKYIVSSAIRRYLRLFFPVAFIILIAFFMMNLHLFYNLDLAEINGSELGKSNWIFSPDVLGMLRQAVWDTFFLSSSPFPSYDYVLWTMSIEFIGSMIAFAYVSLFGQARNRWLIYIVAMLFFINTYYLAFIFGILLADMFNTGGTNNRINNKILLAALMIIGLTMGSFTGDDTYLGNNIFNCINHLVEKPFMFYHILGAFIIVFVLLNSLWLKKQLSTGIATSIGKLSFSMYLVHPLIIASLSSITFLFLYRYLPYNVAALAVLLFTIIVLFVSSYLMYRYVDEPGTQLSKKIYEQYFSGEPKSIDWKSFENRIISFTQKNIIIMIIVELVLVLSIGSMVFIAKPIMDNNRALQAETYYDESITSTIIAYNNLTAYPRFNNTSLGSYRAWLDGYEVRAINFSSNYYGMKQMSELNKQYYSLELQEKTDNDLFFYGNLVNESMNKTQQYEAYYATWYWDNTSKYSLTIPEGN